MDKLKSKEVRQLAKRPDNRSYEVGYAKPPDNTRFKPGKSGNPKGRPKGRQKKPIPVEHESLASIILEEARRSVKVNEGADRGTMSMAKVVMRSLSVNAAKGNSRSQKLFVETLMRAENFKLRKEEQRHENMMKYKIYWEIELDRRSRLGITNLPDPIPHPDDIFVDYRRNTMSIHGPMDKQELAELEHWLKRKNDHEAELKTLKEQKNDPEHAPYLDQLDLDIIFTRRVLAIINSAIAMRANPACIARHSKKHTLTV